MIRSHSYNNYVQKLRYYAQKVYGMKPSSSALSVIIITKNSGQTIEKCLESIKFANEVIVLDSGSVDDTITICKLFTDHVFQTDWPGFGAQKNRALSKTTGDWVLSIDSDEFLSDDLKIEIIESIQKNHFDVFSFKRRNQYCGKWIRFGDVGKDRVTRLFKRGTAHFSDDIVHEKIITSHQIGELKSLLFHTSYQSYEAILERMNWYTSLSAKIRFEKGKKTSFAEALYSSFWAFFKAYFLRLGFLDGKMGFIIAVTSAESSFYRHLKLISMINAQSKTCVARAHRKSQS